MCLFWVVKKYKTEGEKKKENKNKGKTRANGMQKNQICLRVFLNIEESK